VSDVGTNIAGAPTPVGNPYGDWLLWDYLYFDSQSCCDSPLAAQLKYDLHSQRRLDDIQMNYNMVIDVPAYAAFPAVFQVTGRILLKLP
jgi:hypothetical protein